LRSDDGEDETGSADVVEGRCEKLEGYGESEALGASGGEETASDARRRSAEGHDSWRKFSLNQSEAAVAAVGWDCDRTPADEECWKESGTRVLASRHLEGENLG
jgi:hypothetical protein